MWQSLDQIITFSIVLAAGWFFLRSFLRPKKPCIKNPKSPCSGGCAGCPLTKER